MGHFSEKSRFFRKMGLFYVFFVKSMFFSRKMGHFAFFSKKVCFFEKWGIFAFFLCFFNVLKIFSIKNIWFKCFENIWFKCFENIFIFPNCHKCVTDWLTQWVTEWRTSQVSRVVCTTNKCGIFLFFKVYCGKLHTFFFLF